MGRDLPVIGNRAEWNLHRQSGGTLNLSVDNLPARIGGQSNRLDTDSSVAVRPIASPIRVAIGSTRILPASCTSLVGWIESVITSSFSRDLAMRATAPPDSTPWLI